MIPNRLERVTLVVAENSRESDNYDTSTYDSKP
jgi:hypothetical protein